MTHHGPKNDTRPNTSSRQSQRLPQINDDQIRRAVINSSLDRNQRATLNVMCTWLNRYTLEIEVSYEQIADALQLGRRATQKRMKALENSRVLLQVRGGGGRSQSGRGYCNVWSLNLAALEQPLHLTPQDVDNPPIQQNPCNQGEDDITVKGVIEQHQGRTQATPRAQPGAHTSSQKTKRKNKTEQQMTLNPRSKDPDQAQADTPLTQPVRDRSISIKRASQKVGRPLSGYQSRDARMQDMRSAFGLKK